MKVKANNRPSNRQGADGADFSAGCVTAATGGRVREEREASAHLNPPAAFIADTSGAEKLPGINSGGLAGAQSRDQRLQPRGGGAP